MGQGRAVAERGVDKPVRRAVDLALRQRPQFDDLHPFRTSHRMLATILGVTLKAPPVKQTLASKQIQSPYLNRVLARQD
ncbi:MAG: hypothetical protein KJO75_13605 [Dactylosporangium sp.]|nr:hypothetical protein [Dactylosporangium sp.]